MFFDDWQVTGEYLAIALAGAYCVRPSLGRSTEASSLLMQFLSTQRENEK